MKRLNLAPLGHVHVGKGLPRIEPAKQRTLKPLPSRAATSPSTARKRPHRDLTRHLLADARVEAASELGGDAPEVARQALRLFRGGKAELRPAGPSALTAMWSWALATAVAQHLFLRSVRVGESDQAHGLALLDQATRTQGRAERSWTQAMAAIGLLTPNKPRERTVLDEIEADAERALAARREGGESP